MNITERYLELCSEPNYLPGYGILKNIMIDISSDDIMNSSYVIMPRFEKGKLYQVSKIKKCRGMFMCKDICKSNLYSIMVRVYDEKNKNVISYNTCGYRLLHESGEPLFDAVSIHNEEE